MTEWMHCNACIKLPAAGVVYMLTSCGHILCQTCTGKSPAPNTPCLYCKKPAQFVEVTTTMQPQMLRFFRNPKDVAAEMMARLQQTIQFQKDQAKRLQKARAQQQIKITKFVNDARQETKAAIEEEQAAQTELEQLRKELNEHRERAAKLEEQYAERQQEIARLEVEDIVSPEELVDSGNGNDLSFLATAQPSECGSATETIRLLFEEEKTGKSPKENKRRSASTGTIRRKSADANAL